MYLNFLGQDIHLSDFLEKKPRKMPTYFFQVKMGGGRSKVLNKKKISILDRPKTNLNQLNLRNLPHLVTPYPATL